jgi:hypothetical protein
VPIAAQGEPEEVDPIVEVHDAGLVLVEGQPAGGQPFRQPRLDLLGLLPGVTADDHVIGVPDQDRSPRHRCGPGSGTGGVVADPGGLLQAMERHVQ